MHGDEDEYIDESKQENRVTCMAKELANLG